MPDDVRWIRSYVLEERGGTVGTVCIYEARGPEAIRKHASLADLPVDEIVRIEDTVIVRPDPQPVAAYRAAGNQTTAGGNEMLNNEPGRLFRDRRDLSRA